ncbi:HK97 family phage prohead protease [Paroceanicella profunda]|uniref:HK97 family phage prohead protease n=1 Tax=Paroceanicella profunda TaxID=2579971 RepID=A0A5B8FFY8_9RHOB|nr:HK97 family phage prohead protease [Paroceanicella profunda]QDL90467.1 HK97 family phage prohead protease [Paroceanicella profunda]
MLWGALSGGLELRSEGGEIRLRASFPYGRATTLADGGRSGPARQEVIASRAFGARIARGEEIHFLAGHDYNRPLASTSAGSLTLTDGDEALTIEARIGSEMAGVSYVRDFLTSHAAGLIRGLSPGFRVTPAAGAETVEERGGAILRTVRSAELFEISAVTKPAYPSAQIEARSWQAAPLAPRPTAAHPLNRWRP